ncbi:heme oxygenase-domain-containing protein [Cokeromyces recurvatus]|uniref:heme oxygenase-domain-containing protein n=1 Tax=Cokeromyces recurvatus TaxID=90255 RepID=UPI00222053BB|nr:heme oxygenase-domain-containing protein [Cokeromyces recurvatus]KAI7902125.1 heme oxygenase-domain-containing protein [Cokeromyces recurvatus]
MSSDIPPHPGLDTLTNIEELKHLCPAFSKGCPYAKLEEVDTVVVNRGELSRCPAFKEGCPFSNKSKEELLTLMNQIPSDHPTLNMSELPSCEEGVALVKMLNQFLDRSQLENIFNIKSENEVKVEESTDYLKDPQLASAMREGTKAVHRAAETSVFTRRFLKGDINADEYGRYINSLYFVYKYMEELLEEYKEHPVVKLIYFPHELNRKESLVKDLEYFYGQEQAAQLINSETMTPAVKNYVQAMKDACLKSPALLIAHSYSRYLGDLSGGQILAKRLKKHVLHLDDTVWDTTEGLHFYNFSNLGNQADFKNFYRDRLNAAKVNEETRDLIVSEAVRSFELNIALFNEIQELSETNKLTATMIQQKEEKLDVNDQEHQEMNKETSVTITKWFSLITVTVATIAIGTAIYQRYYKK